MPYSKIVWVKLFLCLFNEDDRFLYQLNESQQLLYLKMLVLAGLTSNRIPKKTQFIFNHINYHHDEDCFIKDIKRIMEVFPKFNSDKNFYYFENFENLHNFVSKGNSKGVPKECQRIAPDKSKIREEKDKNLSLQTGVSKDLIKSPPMPPFFLTTIMTYYGRNKGWSDEDTKKMYPRHSRDCKELFLISEGNTEQVFKAIDWVKAQRYPSWTLNAVLKHWNDVKKGNKTDNLPEL